MIMVLEMDWGRQPEKLGTVFTDIPYHYVRHTEDDGQDVIYMEPYLTEEGEPYGGLFLEYGRKKTKQGNKQAQENLADYVIERLILGAFVMIVMLLVCSFIGICTIGTVVSSFVAKIAINYLVGIVSTLAVAIAIILYQTKEM